jgi:hypothetical protein
MFINEQELRTELENIYRQFSMKVKRSLLEDGLGDSPEDFADKTIETYKTWSLNRKFVNQLF